MRVQKNLLPWGAFRFFICVVVMSCSCQLNTSDPMHIKESHMMSRWFGEDVLSLVSSEEDNTEQVLGDPFLKISRHFCSESFFTSWRGVFIDVPTVFFEEGMWIRFTRKAVGDGLSEDLTASVSGLNFPLGVVSTSDFEKEKNAISEACALSRGQDQRVVSGQEKLVFLEIARGLLNRLSPDCHWTFEKERFSCSLEDQTFGSSDKILNDLEKTISSSWKNVPYLYSRRLAITRNLVQASSGQDFQRFCGLLSHALPKELPLVMRSSLWNRSLCSEGENSAVSLKRKRAVAEIGVQFALKELRYESQLARSVNQKGSLRFQLSESEPDDREFFVNLEMKEEAQQDFKKTILASCSSSHTAPQGGWHPLFSQEQLLPLAEVLKLSVIRDDSSLEHEHVLDYLKETVVGETSFFVSHGQTKNLSLPPGMYTYHVKKFSLQPGIEEVSGSFVWKQEDNRPVTIGIKPAEGAPSAQAKSPKGYM